MAWHAHTSGALHITYVLNLSTLRSRRKSAPTCHGLCWPDQDRSGKTHHWASPQMPSALHISAPVGSQVRQMVVCRICTSGWGCRQMSGHSCHLRAFAAPSPGRCWPSSWTRVCYSRTLRCTTCQRTPRRAGPLCGSMSGTGKLKASKI